MENSINKIKISDIEYFLKDLDAENKITEINEQLKNLESRLFIGTRAQYDIANAENLIPLNTLVILTDELDGLDITAKLGIAILGSMILGQE